MTEPPVKSMYNFHIADDHPLFRSALKEVIHQQFKEAEISESYDFGSTLEKLTHSRNIDLLLLDLKMPDSQDLYGLIVIRERFPSIPVVIVSATDDTDMVSRAMAYGASGYIPKSSSPSQLNEALSTLINGDQWLPAAIESGLTSISEDEKSLANKISSLTPQQYRVLWYLKEGWLNKQIAGEMGVTEATVKAHITAIFRKLGVSNRTQAVIEFSKFPLLENTDRP